MLKHEVGNTGDDGKKAKLTIVTLKSGLFQQN